ncbi:MAG: TetR/AcrR family transcriptional regulator, partial [Solobacterium sp.]|nr:TetR/AcrR family transcriptional regulator [Solobacterium sp.]
MKINTEYNSRTIATRTAIGNAILDELETKEYTSIKISDVIRRAGVSRMTFYRYYENLYDALCDYLNIIVNGYMIEGGEKQDPGVYM